MAMSDLFPIIYQKSFQETFNKKNIGLKVANFRTSDEINNVWDTLKRPINVAVPTPRKLVNGADHKINALSPSTESMTIDQYWEASFYLTDKDVLQSNVKTLANDAGKQYAQSLSNKVDADILFQATVATSTVDKSSGDFGGSAGEGIALTEANVRKISTQSTEKLNLLDVDTTDMVAVVPAQYMTFLTDYLASRNTDMGDKIGMNGFAGSYAGIKHYISNNLTGSVNVLWGGNPTNGQTFIVNGKTVTFVSSIGATAGNVLIGGSAALTAANLNTLLNAPSVTTATGVAFAGEDADIIESTVVSTNASGTLTIKFKGKNKASVGAGTSAPTISKYVTHALIAKQGNPTCVMQMGFGTYEANKEPKQIGTINHLRKVLYGVKSFEDERKSMVNVLIDSTSY